MSIMNKSYQVLTTTMD